MQPVSVTKSHNDRRKYKRIVLENKLTALLVSVPAQQSKVTMSAAAICIGIGSLSDPPKVQGLSHLFEHCAFKGSTKFSDERGFDQYLKSHGGSSNAETLLEKTSLFFDVQSDFLKGDLERFADLITDPLLDQDTVKREIQILDCEFQQHLQEDDARYEQLLASLSREGHPLKTFPWGNKESLEKVPDDNKVNVCEQIKSFHKQHYQAQNMTLVVQSTESMSDLELWVTTLFSRVPQSAIPSPTFAALGTPFHNGSFRKVWRVVPVKSMQRVQLTWCFESQPQNYRLKPMVYLALLIIQKRQGSLYTALTKRGWATGIDSDNAKREEEPSSVWSPFNIIITLTDEGMSHLAEVVTLVFQFLKRLRETGAEKWRFVEMRKFDLQEFCWLEQSDAMEYVHQLSVDMQMYSTKDYLTGRRVMLNFDQQVINDYLNRMLPDEMNLTVWSKVFNDRTDLQAEHWFSTLFTVEDLHPDWVEQWLGCQLSSELYLPGPNLFMARDFALKDCTAAGHDLEVISQTAMSRLSYKGNKEFQVPKAHIFFSLMSEQGDDSAEFFCAMDVFARLFDSAIDVTCHTAGLANLRCSVEGCEQGLKLRLDGFSHKLPALFRIIIDEISAFQVTREAFEESRHEVGRTYSDQMLSPEKFNKDLQRALLITKYSSAQQKKDVLDGLDMNMLLMYGNKFFQQCFLEGFSQGNLTEKEALQMEKYVMLSLKHVNAVSTLNEVHLTKLPLGCCQYTVDNPNARDVNTVITDHFQFGKDDLSSRLLNELLVAEMEEPSFYYLRSKSLLGYEMQISDETMPNGPVAFSVSIRTQEQKVSAGYVEYKIEKFLKKQNETVQNMDKNYFINIIQTLINNKNLSPLNLEQDANENWSVVLEGPAKKEISEDNLLKKLTLNQFKEWTSKTLVPSTRQRKLCVRVLGHVPQGQEAEQRRRTNKSSSDLPFFTITDIKKWKSECEHFTKGGTEAE